MVPRRPIRIGWLGAVQVPLPLDTGRGPRGGLLPTRTVATMIPGFVWVVPARLIRWKDGDTCEVKLDVGWRFTRERESIRLLNLWCPELDEPGGREAMYHAYEIAPANSVVIVTSKAVSKTGLWGTSQESLSRTLGDIRLLDGRDFAMTMVADGFGSHVPMTGD